MATRNYSATSAATTNAGSITNSATSWSITAASGLPSAPFIAILDRDLVTEEVILVGTIVGTTVSNVTRGYDGTAAVAHGAGATFEHGVSAIDFREANAHVNATSGVHGISGALVGTADVQTLTNKTLTSPAINTPVVTGGTVTGASISGGTVNPTTLQKGGVNVSTDTEASTLTNKTLTNPTVNAAALSGTITGSPTLSGAPVFSGAASFTGTPTFTTLQTKGLSLRNGSNVEKGSLNANMQLLHGDNNPIPFATEANSVSVSSGGAVTSTTDAVVFTSGRFDVAPLVFVTIGAAGTGSGRVIARAEAVTSSGFNLRCFSGDGATFNITGLQVNWFAVQMTSSTAAG